jgi:hypothetical protein
MVNVLLVQPHQILKHIKSFRFSAFSSIHMYECEGFYDGTSACIIWKGFIRIKTWNFATIELAESIFDRWVKTRNIPADIRFLSLKYKRIRMPILW